MDAILEGAAEEGSETKLVNLRELDMKGCIGCDACKKDLGNCVQKDGFQPLIQEIKEADAIVMGTPVYWYYISAQFKMLVDRLYCFINWYKPLPQVVVP